MLRVSSNLTLALVVFLPFFWTAFFLGLTIALWAYPFDYYGAIPGPALRVGAVFFVLSGWLSFYYTVFRLKRVEVDEQYLYVTNYLKHVRYPHHQVAGIKLLHWGLFRTIQITLKTSGTFGKSFAFLPTGRAFESFVTQHPELRSFWKTPEKTA
jgi:hypothetical protein